MQVYKNYNIQIKGRVQDIGFRNLVENIAKSLNIRGMVYNDIDGTVKIVCGGAAPSVKNLIKELRDKCANVGAAIDEVNQEEISYKVDLPSVFFKAPTDELSDIGRKLDVGVKSIQGIERNTEALSEGQDKMIQSLDSLTEGQDVLVKGQDKMIQSLDSLTEGQDKIIEGQDSLVKGQDKMIQSLDSLTEGQTSLIEGQNSLVKGQDKMIVGQDSLVKGQNRAVELLEKIAEKL